MKLFFFLIPHYFSLIFNYECEAPLKAPPTVENGKLSQIIVLTRHGFRAPFDTYNNFTSSDWVCDDKNSPAPPYHSYHSPKHRLFHAKRDESNLLYKPSCNKAELTIGGQKQHYELGKFYHKYLIVQLGFLEKYFDKEAMKFRTSSPDRCIKSGISFINGLYPSESREEIVNLITGTDATEILHPRPELCNDINNMWEKWTKSQDYIDNKKKAEPFLRELIEKSGLDWNYEYNWLWVGDWLYTIGCCSNAQNKFPEFISQEQLDVAIKAVEFFTLKFFQYQRGVAGATIIREVLNIIDQTISLESNNKFTLLSAHDVSIVSAAALLGVNLEKIPPFRSHMSFEKWQVGNGFYIRVVLNGKVIVEPIPYIKFRQMVLPYLHFCIIQ